MSDRIDDLVTFLYEINAWPRLKKIRVYPLLYNELLLRCLEDDRPMIEHQGRPQAFLLGVPVDCDENLTQAFELDYAP